MYFLPGESVVLDIQSCEGNGSSNMQLEAIQRLSHIRVLILFPFCLENFSNARLVVTPSIDRVYTSQIGALAGRKSTVTPRIRSMILLILIK
jgi:hypothetical protein